MRPESVNSGIPPDIMTGEVSPGANEYVVPEIKIIPPGVRVFPSITRPDESEGANLAGMCVN